MAQPRSYTQTNTFNDWTTTNPSDPHIGSKFDTEFTELKQNTDDLNTNLALLQRDDGKLLNEAVHKDAFDQDALALIGLSGYTVRGAWTPTTAYAVGDIVTNNDATYLNSTVHTSDTFSTDIANWTLLANAAINVTGHSVDTLNGLGPINLQGSSWGSGGSRVITHDGSPTGTPAVGQHITHASFPAGTKIASIDSSTQATADTDSTAAGSSQAVDLSRGFTLTYSYSSDTDFQVFIAGVLTSPTLFEVSSTTLTFTTAPAVGTGNIIVWGGGNAVEAAKTSVITFRDDTLDHRDTAEDYALRVGNTVRHFDGATDNVSDTNPTPQSGVYSAAEYAIGTTAATGSSKQWALGGGSFVVGTAVEGSNYSAKKYAADAVNTETAVISVANAMSNMHNNFDDRYLGALASSHTVAAASSITGAVWTRGSSLITSATQASGTITVGQVLTNDGSATGWPTTTTVRILAYNSGTSTITINQIFSDAQAGGETLTGVGYGVQGAYVVADLGPAKDNDGNTLLDGSLYYNTTTDALMVYDLGNTIWKYTKPNAADQANIDIVGGNLLFKEDLGLITGAVTSSSGNNISEVADNKTNIDLVAGQISPTNHISTLGPIAADITTVATAPIPANMATIVGLGTNGSEVTAVAGKATEIGRLGTTAAIADMATLGTPAIADPSTGDLKLVADIHANVTKVANIDTNVTKVADIDGDVTIVAGLGTNGVDVTTVAGKADEVGRLGTADAVADMVLLTATGVIADMDAIGATGVIDDLETVANISTDITQVVGELVYKEDLGGIADAVTTSTGNNITDVADNETNINLVAGQISPTNNIAALGPISANITTVAGIGTNGADVTTVAGKDTEIGLLGTSAMATAGTGHLAYLGTAAMANTTDGHLKVLGVAGVVTTIGTVSTNIANVNLTGGSIANVNLTGGSIANVNTVGAAIADVNRYATEYTISGSQPGSPSAGDLWYDSTANVLKYHTGSAFSSISGGIAEVADDTTPTLGGDLDADSNDITNVGEISGTNLNIDFGSIA